MISVGLTGGIGCGKSTVAGMFASLGAVMVNSDDIGRTLMQPGGVVYDRIVSGFGSEVVDSNGQLDRAKLADIVFHNLEKLKHLNAIVHAPVAPRKVRKHAKLTQAQMAALMGMSLSGYRKWEQGTRRVSGPAATLLRIIEHEPNAVRRALLSSP